MSNRATSRTRRKRRPPSPQTPRKSPASRERLQKVLAAAGVGSRRKCEQLILDGRVEVDRQLVTELGTRVDPRTQDIRLDGVRLRQPRRSYYVIHKPPGVVSTNLDPEGRPRVVDLIESDQRLFTVGRLDKSSEGLILVTNDGELAQRLMHPRYGVERTYLVTVAGSPTREALDKLRQGIHLAEGVVSASRIRVKRRQKRSSMLEMVLTEGRNREIRRMAARIGHKVLALKRIGLGPLRLGELPRGAYRQLTSVELRKLMHFKAGNREESLRKPPRKATS